MTTASTDGPAWMREDSPAIAMRTGVVITKTRPTKAAMPAIHRVVRRRLSRVLTREPADGPEGADPSPGAAGRYAAGEGVGAGRETPTPPRVSAPNRSMSAARSSGSI